MHCEINTDRCTKTPIFCFEDDLHESGFISTPTLVRFETDTPCNFFLRGQERWPLYIVIECGRLDHLRPFWLTRDSLIKEALLKMGTVFHILCKAFALGHVKFSGKYNFYEK